MRLASPPPEDPKRSIWRDFADLLKIGGPLTLVVPISFVVAYRFVDPAPVWCQNSNDGYAARA